MGKEERVRGLCEAGGRHREERVCVCEEEEGACCWKCALPVYSTGRLQVIVKPCTSVRRFTVADSSLLY